MSRAGEEPDNTPPRSLVDPEEFQVKRRETGLSLPQYSPPRNNPDELIRGIISSPVSYNDRKTGQFEHEDDGDAASNVQDGVRSDVGDPMPPTVCFFLFLVQLYYISTLS
jgi:hypothetical protein